VNDRQVIEEIESPDEGRQLRRRYSFHPQRQNNFDYPYLPWPGPYLYPPQWSTQPWPSQQLPAQQWSNLSNWYASRTNAEANAIAICGYGGRSHSAHDAYRWPHVPPLTEEKQIIESEVALRQTRETDIKKQALNEYIMEHDKIEKERKHSVADAIKRMQLNDRKEKEKTDELKKKWEADKAAEIVKNDELKKKWEAEKAAEKEKKEKEIENEIRTRMASAGYHNRNIEAVVAGKKENYCHEHNQSYPCHFCMTMTASCGIRRGRDGRMQFCRRSWG
jgi:hypothetical protein